MKGNKKSESRKQVSFAKMKEKRMKIGAPCKAKIKKKINEQKEEEQNKPKEVPFAKKKKERKRVGENSDPLTYMASDRARAKARARIMARIKAKARDKSGTNLSMHISQLI